MNKKETKKPEREISVFKYKIAYLKILERIYCDLDERINYILDGLEENGEEQCIDYSTGEPKWLDEEKTIPKMRPKYKHYVKEPEQLDEEEYAEFLAAKMIKDKLEGELSKL